MDQVLNKVGSYWFSKRASKEIDSIGDDLNVRTPIPGLHCVYTRRVSAVCADA